MPKVDELVGALEAESALTAEGAFTLDREKAREKMRRFQLPDPRMYVLSLVQLAAMQGAERIDIEVDSDDLTATFEGAVLGREDLDELYASLLGGPGATPARQELAIAVNGAMALNPRRIEIRSCWETRDHNATAGRRVLRLRCAPDQPDEIDESQEGVEEMSPGTRIHVRERFRAGLAIRFFRMLRGELAEQVHLRERCRWARIDVRDRGFTVSRERAHPQLRFRYKLKTGGVRVVAGLDDALPPARLRLLCGGVWIEDRDFEGPPGLEVFCDGPAFRKNVSRTGIVADDVFEAAMVLVERARREVFKAMAESVVDGEDVGPHDARTLVLDELDRVGPPPAQPEPWLRALLDVRVWPSIVSEQWVSTWELATDPDGAGFATEAFEGLDEEWRTTARVPQEDWDRFVRLFPERDDRTEGLRERSANLELRRKWRQRARAPTLEVASWLVRVPIRGDGVRGEVGIAEGGASQPRIHLVADGCLLCSMDWARGLPGTHIIVEAGFEPTEHYDGAVANAVLGDALTRALMAVRGAWRKLAKSHRKPGAAVKDRLRAYLARGADTRAAFAAFTAVGLTGKDARTRVREAGAKIAHRWALGEEQPHPVCHCALFDRLDGRVTTLAEVHEQLEASGHIPVVPRALLDDDAALDVYALVVEDADLRVLGAVFGDRVITDRRDLVKKEIRSRAAKRSEAALRAALGLEDDVSVVAFEHGELAGALGFDDTRDREAASITLLVRGAVSATLRWDAPVRHVVAAVEVSWLAGEAAGTLDARERERVEAAVAHGIGLAFHQLAAKPSRGRSDAERLLEGLCAGLRSTLWLRALAALRRDAPREDADAAFVALVRLSHGTYWDVLSAEVSDALRQGRGLGVDAVARALKIRDRVDAPSVGLVAQVTEALPLVAELPLFTDSAGQALSLAAVVDASERGRIGVLEPALADPEYDGRDGLLVVARGTAARVLRGLDDIRWTPGRTLLIASQRRRSVEQRSPREALELPPDAAVVEARVDRPACRGVVGLAPGTKASTIEICVGMRPVGRVHPDVGVPLRGVLNFDDLDLDFAFDEDGLVQAHWRRVEARCRDMLPALFGRLAEHGDAAVVAALVRRTVLHPTLRHEAPLRDVVDALPAFAGIDGRWWSVTALRGRVEDAGEVDVVPTRWHGEGTGEPVIRVRRADRRAFVAVVGKTRDYRMVAAAEVRKAKAAPVGAVPDAALAKVEVRAGGLRGQLYAALPADGAAVELAYDGKVAGRVRASPWWPVRGFVQGDGVEVRTDWSGATLDSAAAAALHAAAASVFEQLVTTMERFLGGDPAPFDGPAARELLAGVATHLALDAAPEMYARLEQLPLFELPSGVLVSLGDARRDKPASLEKVWAEHEEPAGVETPEEEAAEPDAEDGDDPELESESEPESESASESEPEPEPEPEPGVLEPEVARVVEAVREHLRSVLARADADPTTTHLHRLIAAVLSPEVVSESGEADVTLNLAHPVFVAAREGDLAALVLLSSSAYTSLNRLREDITDDHEADFHDVHAERSLAAFAAGRPRR